MAKSALVEEDIHVSDTIARVASPDEAYVDPYDMQPANAELQAEVDTQRAFDAQPETPMQPYLLDSSAFKADLLKRKAILDTDVALLEGQRDGMNARIDDMNYVRNAVNAALATLK